MTATDTILIAIVLFQSLLAACLLIVSTRNSTGSPVAMAAAEAIKNSSLVTRELADFLEQHSRMSLSEREVTTKVLSSIVESEVMDQLSRYHDAQPQVDLVQQAESLSLKTGAPFERSYGYLVGRLTNIPTMKVDRDTVPMSDGSS